MKLNRSHSMRKKISPNTSPRSIIFPRRDDASSSPIMRSYYGFRASTLMHNLRLTHARHQLPARHARTCIHRDVFIQSYSRTDRLIRPFPKDHNSHLRRVQPIKTLGIQRLLIHALKVDTTTRFKYIFIHKNKNANDGFEKTQPR